VLLDRRTKSAKNAKITKGTYQVFGVLGGLAVSDFAVKTDQHESGTVVLGMLI
jgi:hypothetical protein